MSNPCDSRRNSIAQIARVNVTVAKRGKSSQSSVILADQILSDSVDKQEQVGLGRICCGSHLIMLGLRRLPTL